MAAREKFDAKRSFVVQRPFQFNGKAHLSGTKFEKDGVSQRRLQQLYDQRYLSFDKTEAQPAPKAAPRTPRTAPVPQAKSTRRRLQAQPA